MGILMVSFDGLLMVCPRGMRNVAEETVLYGNICRYFPRDLHYQHALSTI
jgi:hypothetical protein